MKLIENIEEDIKMSVDDVIHVIKTLRTDVDQLKKDVKQLKSRKKS